MVSPRLRPAVPLPSPIDSTKIRQLLAAEIVTTLAAWALPALLVPTPWFTALGIPEPGPEQLLFIRLWGAASIALVTGYALAWRAPTRHPAAILSAIVANALTVTVIVSVGASGGYDTWSGIGSAYAWGSAIAAAGLGIALAIVGQPLLKRLVERPRGGSMKIV